MSSWVFLSFCLYVVCILVLYVPPFNDDAASFPCLKKWMTKRILSLEFLKKCVHSNLTSPTPHTAGMGFLPPNRLGGRLKGRKPRMINSFLAHFTNELRIFFFSAMLNIALYTFFWNIHKLPEIYTASQPVASIFVLRLLPRRWTQLIPSQ